MCYPKSSLTECSNQSSDNDDDFGDDGDGVDSHPEHVITVA